MAQPINVSKHITKCTQRTRLRTTSMRICTVSSYFTVTTKIDVNKVWYFIVLVVDFCLLPYFQIKTLEYSLDAHYLNLKNISTSKKDGKDQESILSSTTTDPGYQWESNKLTIRDHKREPRGQPFPSSRPQDIN